MRPTRYLIFAATLAGLGARAALPDTLFSIGKDDQSCAEFALAKGAGWQAYAATFTQPVRFAVGQSKPEADWPYIHPNTHNRSGRRQDPPLYDPLRPA